ncbi:uncharacterized protein LY89DRAFT_254763 [Mollisia scopiformis]|uniref:DUF7730 domain-containing protein n=1 Tax=Mollisia scopiformis TaxID=149040 RepID=A0A132BCT5_MOLSC|nr:uncharacterized protein LY89DRAFT_254763 [Mollisia scopiformis]KUJ10242.1 hypothetical protein LY89DRAFT_254763 [Mollisia scopiformis]
MTPLLRQLQIWGAQWHRDDYLKVLNDKIAYWARKPYPMRALHQEIDALFVDDPHLLETLDQFLVEKFPKQIAKAEEARIEQEETHRIACEIQSESRLLTLPREIRDKIWEEAVIGQVIHISHTEAHSPKRRRPGRPKRAKFLYHACKAGLHSSACPPGQGDHINCSTDGPSDFHGISLVCRQVYLELPASDSMLSNNALQFSDLNTADRFLFGLDEDIRASVTHLKLAVPYSLTGRIYPLYGVAMADPWQSICNYYSNPWDRKSLRMYPKPNDQSHLLREPIHFYYSGCYYAHNRDRLYRTWQVGRGNTSWDVTISELKYRGCPRLEVAMACPTAKEIANEASHHSSAGLWRTEFETHPQSWLIPLLQFRNYDQLGFQFYDKDGVKDFQPDFVAALKEHIAGLPIGPQICAFFAGGGYANGQAYQL